MTQDAALSDVCSMITDGTHYTPPALDDGVPFLTVRDMVEPGLAFDTSGRISNEEFARARSGNSAPQPGDVLFSKDGTVGKVHVVREDRDFAVLSSIAILRPQPSVLDAEYLGHALRSPIVLRGAMHTGTAIRRVVLADLRRIRIPLPSLSRQRLIAKALAVASATRHTRRQSLVRLEELVASIFNATFGELVGAATIYVTLPLEEVLARPLLAGAYFPKDSYVTTASDGVEMVHMSDAFYGQVRRGALKRVDCSPAECRKYGVSPVDLLIARRSLNYSGAAKPCLVPSGDGPLIFESSLLRATPDPARITTEYLYRYLNDERVRRAHVYKVVTGTTISGISQTNLAKVPVVVPPLPLQERFGRVVSRVSARRLAYVAHLHHLDALFASVQHRAFTGGL